jgi:hypothetical protein
MIPFVGGAGHGVHPGTAHPFDGRAAMQMPPHFF